MTTYQFTAAEVLERRQELMDVEIILMEFMDRLYTHDDSAVTKVVGPALACAARENLLGVLHWMEELNDAKEAEAAQ